MAGAGALTIWAVPLSCQPPAVGEGMDPGGGVTYVYRSAALVSLVPPPEVTTVTSTVPVPGGAVEMSVVELLKLKLAATAPKLTAVAPVKFVPVIVTMVLPVLGPEFGLRPVTVGAGGGGGVT